MAQRLVHDGPLLELQAQLVAEQDQLVRGKSAAKLRMAKAGRNYVRLATVRRLIELLEVDLAEARPLQLRLELDRLPLRTPKRMTRYDEGSDGARIWLTLAGTFSDGTRFRLRVRERQKKRVRFKRKPGKQDKRKRKNATTVDLRLRFKTRRYPSPKRKAVLESVQLPSWVRERQAWFTPGELRLKSKTQHEFKPEQLLPWLSLSFLSLYQALNGARRAFKAAEGAGQANGDTAAAPSAVKLLAPAPATPAKARPAIQLFQNLVLAALADGRIDEAEWAFLTDRAQRLGLSEDEVRSAIQRGRAHPLGEIYAPADPAVRAEAFKELVRVLHVDGEVVPREQRLIAVLGERMKIAPELIRQALG